VGNEAVFVGLALKLLAEIRMGDGDEGKGALGDRLSFQVDEAIFSDDVHDVGAGVVTILPGVRLRTMRLRGSPSFW